MWESRRDFQRVWEGWEAASWLSILCHFHGLPLEARKRRRMEERLSLAVP